MSPDNKTESQSGPASQLTVGGAIVTGGCVFVCVCRTGHTQLEVGVHATYLKLTTGNNNCDILVDNNNKWKNIVPSTKHSLSIFLFLLIYL